MKRGVQSLGAAIVVGVALSFTSETAAQSRAAHERLRVAGELLMALEVQGDEVLDRTKRAAEADKVVRALEAHAGPVDGYAASLWARTGDVYFDAGHDERAEMAYARVVDALKVPRDPDDAFILAGALSNLGQLAFARGRYDAALEMLNRAAKLSPSVETTVRAAACHLALGDAARARAALEAAKASDQCAESAVSTPDASCVLAASYLAVIHSDRGDSRAADRELAELPRALALMPVEMPPAARPAAASAVPPGSAGPRRVLTIGEVTIVGRVERASATALANFASVYRMRGDFDSAERLLRRALAVDERYGTPVDAAADLNDLAVVATDRHELAEAEGMLRRALASLEPVLASEHHALVRARLNLAIVLDERGRIAAGENLVNQVIADLERAPVQDSLALAAALHERARLSRAAAKYVDAEANERRALALRLAALGPDHPTVARSHEHLGTIALARGETEAALAHYSASTEIHDRRADDVLGTGSAAQKSAYLASLRHETDAVLALAFEAHDPRATELALRTVLRRKGRAIDAMARGLGALRERAGADEVALLDALATTRGKLASLIMRGPGDRSRTEYMAALDALGSEARALESRLGSRAAALASGSTAGEITAERVRAALPEKAILVEVARYAPFDPRSSSARTRYRPARYVAFVLPKRGPVASIDLGEADAVDERVAALRRALINPRDDHAAALARAFDQEVIRTIRTMAGPARDWFVSFDGNLDLVPLGALIDEHGNPLVARYTITHLTSGRELLRSAVAARDTPSRGPSEQAVVVGGPDFGPPVAQGDASGGGTLRSAVFRPLPGAQREVASVARSLNGARLLTGAAATESAVKELRSPRILHIATHGFYIPSARPIGMGSGATRLAALGGRGVAGAIGRDAPLLRSGIALAGANDASGTADTGDDGVLTAFEASGLNLTGTKLVVLSACDTGVGDITEGDGVYGLRRALALAGAETQVMSLWKVDDTATVALMTRFYEHLARGEGRTDALRLAQLSVRASPQWSHPYYWAGFISSGSAASLDGTPPKRSASPVAAGAIRGARGCACGVARREGDAALHIGCALVAAVLVGRRCRGRAIRGSAEGHHSPEP